MWHSNLTKINSNLQKIIGIIGLLKSYWPPEKVTKTAKWNMAMAFTFINSMTWLNSSSVSWKFFCLVWVAECCAVSNYCKVFCNLHLCLERFVPEKQEQAIVSCLTMWVMTWILHCEVSNTRWDMSSLIPLKCLDDQCGFFKQFYLPCMEKYHFLAWVVHLLDHLLEVHV